MTQVQIQGKLAFSEDDQFFWEHKQVNELLLELKSAFGVMDANHDGKLSPDEIRKIIKKVNGDLSEYDLNELIDSLDADHDGKVNFDGNRIT